MDISSSLYMVNSTIKSLSICSIFLLLIQSALFRTLFPAQTDAYFTGMGGNTVVGQPDLFSSDINQLGNPAANTLNTPGSVIVVGSQLIVSDNGNNRVLIYTSIPTAANASANTVIGQSSMTTKTNACTQTGLFLGEGKIFSINSKLFIADTQNNRVLIYNKIPTTNNPQADVVIGQSDFTHCNINQGGSVTGQTLQNPIAVASDGKRLLIADRGNNRVLVYNTIPSTNNPTADLVIGQSNLLTRTANSLGVSASSLASPSAVTVNTDGRVIIGDLNNNRALDFNSIPTVSSASANSVLGQSSFTNFQLPTGNSFNATSLRPFDVGFDNLGRLFVADRANHRVTIFNAIPAANNPSADLVLGQQNFTTNTANNGGLVQDITLSGPTSVFVTGTQLFVADSFNNRVVIYANTSSQPSLTLASTPVGQPDGPLQRFTGTAATNSNYLLRGVEYSVNYNSWNVAIPTDGIFNDDPSEDFYFDFDPGENNSTTSNGYNVRVRAINNNGDTTSNAFYFDPFLPLDPTGNPLLTAAYPPFQFQVHNMRTQMRDNVSKYQIWIKQTTAKDWKLYLDNIPVDFATVKGNGDNMKADTYKNVQTNNGIYENTAFSAEYSQESSVIKVHAKESTQQSFYMNGKALPSGSYQWKAVAYDNEGHLEESPDKPYFRINSAVVLASTSFFPLSITNIDGAGSVDFSSLHPDDIPSSLSISTATPTISGIAFSGSSVLLQFSDSSCTSTNPADCAISYAVTTDASSKYAFPIPPGDLSFGKRYTLFLSASKGNNYVELPGFDITIGNVASLNKNADSSGQQSRNILKETPFIDLTSVIKNKKIPHLCSISICI